MASQSPPAAPNSPAFFIPCPILGSMFLNRHKKRMKSWVVNHCHHQWFWSHPSSFQNYINIRHNGANAFCFQSSFPPSHHSSVWLLPVISLLLNNTVLPVRTCLSIWWERFCGTQKEDDRGPLSIQSSLARHVHVPAILSALPYCIHGLSLFSNENDGTKSHFTVLTHPSVKATKFSLGKTSNRRRS